MNARDELAELIASVTIDTKSGDVLRVAPDGETPVFEGDQRTADALLAAGYRKPRTITTAEELDALPVGSVIIPFERGAFLRVNVPSFDWIDGQGNMSYTSTLDRFLPATVLPEATP